MLAIELLLDGWKLGGQIIMYSYSKFICKAEKQRYQRQVGGVEWGRAMVERGEFCRSMSCTITAFTAQLPMVSNISQRTTEVPIKS
jgi:hypothetical protein